jgi:hypothetical protein
VVIRSVAFPVLLVVSALLRGSCDARRLRRLCFALKPFRFWLPRAFIGSDAERKATNSTKIAIFSLATKTSWKNDVGSWESRTEWHR